MRLFKLLAYALFGYAIYEFVRGVLEDPDLKQSASAPQGIA